MRLRPGAGPGPARLAGRLGIVALIAGCGGGRPAHEREGPRALPLSVLADSGRATTLHVSPPHRDPAAASGPTPSSHAAAWLTRVAPSREDLSAMPAPEPAADTLASGPPPPRALVVDERLRPPIPRERSPLLVPRGARGSVELDVRVDERGQVSEARWAAGSRDPAMVAAATECARAMRFFAAERAGRPVAVWCRQRFDFGVAEP